MISFLFSLFLISHFSLPKDKNMLSMKKKLLGLQGRNLYILILLKTLKQIHQEARFSLSNYRYLIFENFSQQNLLDSYQSIFHLLNIVAIIPIKTIIAKTTSIPAPKYPNNTCSVAFPISIKTGAITTVRTTTINKVITPSIILSSAILIHHQVVFFNWLKSLWVSLFSKNSLFLGDIFDTPNRDAHTYSQKIILSITQCVFLYTLKQISIKDNTIGILSPMGEFERGKTFPHLSQITLTVLFIRFQDKFFILMVMSPNILRLSPSFKEYFQRPQSRVYKECNRYKISNITLDNFGLKIFDQGKLELPKVWKMIGMLSTPEDEKTIDVDKSFCCTHCGSENFTKYGKENNKQMYKCKDCNKKFVDNLYFEKLKGDPNTICLVLDLYFKGVSLRKIADHLKQFYKINVYHTTILRWIERYIEIMDRYVSQFKPKLGSVWQTDEMMVQVDGNWFYLWNVIDSFTRFHLASVISKERKIKDARKAFQQAKKCSKGDRPRCIVTDGLQTYKKAINKEFHTVKKETIHIGNVGIKGKRFRNAKFDNNLVERLHGTVRDRNKTQRGLEKEDSMFIKGHQLYYNFIRPHDGLNGYTPAHFANIYLNLGENKWKDLLMQSVKNNRSDVSSDK